MALVGGQFTLTVTLLDNGANDTTLLYQLRATNFNDAVTDAADIITALQAVTDGAISSYRISREWVEDALSLPASGGVQAEVSASLTTLIEDKGNKKANYRIPMPKPSIFNSTIGSGANTVNTANASVLAYHALFSPNGKAFVSDGEEAGGLLSGVRVTRSRRGG